MTTLPSLPNEILHAIASALPPHPSRDRLHLALVSHQMRDISKPFWYLSISFKHEGMPKDGVDIDQEYPCEAIRHLSTILTQNAALRPLVRSLTLQVLFTCTMEWALLILLPLLPALTDLHLVSRFEISGQGKGRLTTPARLGAALQPARHRLKRLSLFLDNTILTPGESIGSLAALSALETLDIQISVLLGFQRHQSGGRKDRSWNELLTPHLKQLTIRCSTTNIEGIFDPPMSTDPFWFMASLKRVMRFLDGYMKRNFPVLGALRKIVVALPSWIEDEERQGSGSALRRKRLFAALSREILGLGIEFAVQMDSRWKI